MKAVILAGGYGTRLGEIAYNTAKPLIKINNKPIVEHIVEKLFSLDIDQIFIVTNNKFYHDFVHWKNDLGNKRINIINDGTMSNEDRLGAVGDINFVIQQNNINEDLLIVGGDNLFEDDLLSLISHFNEKGSTILLNDVQYKEKAKLYGIVTLNDNNKIIKFIEKPEKPESTFVSTLIYALKKEHLPLINMALKEGFADRAGDFVKYLAEREHVSGITLNGRWFDIGSIESLKEAENYFK